MKKFIDTIKYVEINDEGKTTFVIGICLAKEMRK